MADGRLRPARLSPRDGIALARPRAGGHIAGSRASVPPAKRAHGGPERLHCHGQARDLSGGCGQISPLPAGHVGSATSSRPMELPRQLRGRDRLPRPGTRVSRLAAGYPSSVISAASSGTEGRHSLRARGPAAPLGSLAIATRDRRSHAESPWYAQLPPGAPRGCPTM